MANVEELIGTTFKPEIDAKGKLTVTDPEFVRVMATLKRDNGILALYHDMFQLGYGAASTPPTGIPDPEFNPYHRQVLEFIAMRERYMPPPPE